MITKNKKQKVYSYALEIVRYLRSEKITLEDQDIGELLDKFGHSTMRSTIKAQIIHIWGARQ